MTLVIQDTTGYDIMEIEIKGDKIVNVNNADITQDEDNNIITITQKNDYYV